MVVRTRFAPSPTGFLHLGGVRTALFSWLFAKHHQGQFILRIEDTDQERSTKESVQVILDAMNWLDMDYDEGPFYQTSRFSRYKDVVQRLLDEGKAYHCNCSKERLESLREVQLNAKEKPRYDGHCRDKHLNALEGQVIRFKTPHHGTVSFRDQVYGDIHIDNNELDDLILVRSDGYPTYNFAVVVDDWDMAITHVIRGEEHINNTPRQIHLFNALSAPIPIFAHLPIILGNDGKKLSKRHGAMNVLEYKEQGFLPHALLNYLVRLGWSHGDQEIFTRNEMIERFNLANVSRGVSAFNPEKLIWLNQHYQKSDPAAEVAKSLKWQFDKRQIDVTQGPNLEDVVCIQAERCKTLADMCEKSLYFFQDNIHYDDEAVKKHLRPVALPPLEALYDKLSEVNVWSKDNVQTCINDVAAAFDINMGKVAQPLRVAVTGTSMSPAIDMTLALLGKERTLSRLNESLVRLRERAAEMNK